MSTSDHRSDDEQRTRRAAAANDAAAAGKTAATPKTWPRRRRLAPDGSNQLSRPLTAALIVIVAGGAYLFWPRGGGAPMGIGEHITVITADSTTYDRPRSGSVDIQTEQPPLVAEKPVEPSRPTTRAALPTATEPLPALPAGSPPAPAPAPTPPAPTPSARPQPEPTQPQPALPQSRPRAPAPQEPAQPARQIVETAQPSIQPQTTGRWAVQVGAYGSEANAEAMAERLKAAGIDAQVRAASTSSGDLVFRVWICWFESRDQALAYAAQERSRIGEAHPVHR